MNDCNSNQFLYAIVIDNCSYWCGFVVHKLQRVPQMNFSNCIAYTHTHTRMWREREEREHPLGPPLAAGRVRPSSQSKSFSATDALPCDIGQVEQSYQQYLRRWDKARRHAGLGSKCCQRRCRQSVPRLFVDCLFLFFSGNSRERAKGGHSKARRESTLRTSIEWALTRCICVW